METISPGISKAVVAAAMIALVAIPAWVHRSEPKTIARGARTGVERALLGLVAIAFLSAAAWVATPLLGFADFRIGPIRFACGLLVLLVALWLLYRSHGDLGATWSITLELRENHRLVTCGVYRRLRHPMYSALLLYGLGQALVLPNWLAGPAYLAAVALMVAGRLRREEQMMAEMFGADYEAYRRRTERLIPGLW